MYVSKNVNTYMKVISILGRKVILLSVSKKFARKQIQREDCLYV